jgi:hypothetical protein
MEKIHLRTMYATARLFLKTNCNQTVL